MKKIITIILIAIIVIPFFPDKNVQASTSKDQSTPGTFKDVKTKAIFYSVGQKNGMTFSGANGGANNFFDALKQSNYEMHMDNNPKLTKGGKKPSVRFEEIKKEFTQTPKKVRPGVGKITLTGVAFGFVSDMILNSWTEFVYGLQKDYKVKVLEDFVTAQGGKKIADIPGIIYFTSTVQNIDKSDRQWYYVNVNTDKLRITSIGDYYVPGHSSTQLNIAGTETIGEFTYYKFIGTVTGMHYRTLNWETTSKNFYIGKDFLDNNNPNTVTEKEPKSLGTLTNPSWDTGNETDIPGFVELEVPITEDGEIDLDRQLSPDNPAINDPKKPLAPVKTPDYTVPEEDSEEGKKPVPSPNLTPKPNPNTNPLPNPSPLPKPDPTKPPTTPGTPGEDIPNTKPGDTQNRWAALITNKFPFSLPWDIGNMIEPLLAEPVRPSVKVNVSFDAFGREVPIKFSHNFAWMDDFIGFFRIFILIGFNLFMITGTRKLMGGGQ